MNTGAFLTCLGYCGIDTGVSTSLEGLYSPSSGSTNVLYNQLYTTGYHYQNGLIYAPAKPLINVWETQVTNNTFSGNNGFRAGYQHTGNFAILMDIQHSGCVKYVTSGYGLVLLSTVESYQGYGSGFIIGINDANCLYFKTLNKSVTLPTELSSRDFVFVALTEKQYVDFGIYRPIENKFYLKNVDMGTGQLDTPNIYIGNFLTNTPSQSQCYGFSGKIHNILLFNDNLKQEDVVICANCSLATGISTYSLDKSFSGNRITGVYFSGIWTSIVTGYATTTGYVGQNDGGSYQVVYPSGMTGFVQTGSQALPLLQQVTINVQNSGYRFLYDTSAQNTFSTFSITFDPVLTSGDVLEIYSYAQPDSRIGNHIEGTAWPTGTGFVQLIGNGLNETQDVDYAVVRNSISGFYDSDVLSYDILPSGTKVTVYSGYWQNSRVSVSGSGWFPSAPQYVESTTAFSGQVKITGMSGVSYNNPYYPSFGYDLWMNGQKLVSGWQYDVTTSGANIFVVSLSGKDLPLMMVDALYDVTGGGPTGIRQVWTNELTFSPIYSGFRRVVTGLSSTMQTFSYVTGFSEQVWVNGIRQLVNHDYQRAWPCSRITGEVIFPTWTYEAYNSLVADATRWGAIGVAGFPNPLTFTLNQTSYDCADWTLGFQSYPSNYYIVLYNPASPSEIWATTAYGETGATWSACPASSSYLSVNAAFVNNFNETGVAYFVGYMYNDGNGELSWIIT